MVPEIRVRFNRSKPFSCWIFAWTEEIPCESLIVAEIVIRSPGLTFDGSTEAEVISGCLGKVAEG